MEVLVEESTGARCAKTVSEDGSEFYVPLFDMKEIAALDPEKILERVRAVHIEHGQLDTLRIIDKSVEANGNPYAGKPLAV